MATCMDLLIVAWCIVQWSFHPQLVAGTLQSVVEFATWRKCDAKCDPAAGSVPIDPACVLNAAFSCTTAWQGYRPTKYAQVRTSGGQILLILTAT